MNGVLRGSFSRNKRDAAIAALAVPALGTLAIDPVVSIVDTAWVGRLGTEPLAALAVASAIFAVVFSVFNFVHVAITPLVAGEVGRGDLDRAGDIAKGAQLIAVALGVVVALVINGVAEPIVGLFGADGIVGELAASYLKVRILSLPALLLAMVCHGVYRGHQNTKTPLYVVVGMNLVNLALDPIFIFVLDWGVVGAAWATVVSQSTSAAAFLYLMFVKEREGLGMGGDFKGIGSFDIGRILRSGWPMMLRSTALLLGITATTVAATRIGIQQVAAHQIALQTWLFISLVLDSYAIAAMAMIGTDLGAGDYRAARDVANRLLALGLITGVLLGVGFAVLAPHIGGFFSVTHAVETELRSVLWFVVILQPITALVYVWDGIGIGASAFKFMAASTIVSALLTILTLVAVGDTLVGVWSAVTVLTVTRLVTFAWWHLWGPFSYDKDPSHVSQEPS